MGEGIALARGDHLAALTAVGQHPVAHDRAGRLGGQARLELVGRPAAGGEGHRLPRLVLPLDVLDEIFELRRAEAGRPSPARRA